jgi:hypothetical protein
MMSEEEGGLLEENEKEKATVSGIRQDKVPR